MRVERKRGEGTELPIVGLTYRIKNYFDYLWSRQQGIDDQEVRFTKIGRPNKDTDCLLDSR